MVFTKCMSEIARKALALAIAALIVCAGGATQAYAEDDSTASWLRLAGPTALDTMTSIVSEGDFEQGGTVVIASAEGYWDALAASGVAGLFDAPVLMTNGMELSSQTKALLEKLAPKQVVICGGTDSISDAVATQVKQATKLDAEPVRLAGSNAALTAEAMVSSAGKLSSVSWGRTALVCTDEGYWDALSAAAIAYHAHFPLVLTQAGGPVPASTVTSLQEQGVASVYIVGGEVSVSPAVVESLEAMGMHVEGRISGDNAVETSEALAEFALSHCGMVANRMGVATATTYHDALVGAALCGKLAAPVVLVAGERSHVVSSEGFVAKNAEAIECGFLFGGTSAIDGATEFALTWASRPWEVETTRQKIERWAAGEAQAQGGVFYRQSEAVTLDLPATANQVIIVRAREDTTCTLALHERVEGLWRQTYPLADGYIGTQGVGVASEGLSVTPEGIFELGFAFGNAPNPGTKMEYRQVTDSIYWVDDPDSLYYNRWVDTSVSYPDWSSAEHLASVGDDYRYAVVIQYNMHPVVSGAGSAFFLHCRGSAPSEGCVQTSEATMVDLLERLRDGAYIAIFAA